jgi:hypothetical protein
LKLGLTRRSSRPRPARAFCKATGLSEDMLGHVLAGRKELSLEALRKGLERIGYRLRIVLGPGRQPAARGWTG